jgi:hypothetical protein
VCYDLYDGCKGAGVLNFVEKGQLWQKRRGIAPDFWT